MKTYRKHLLRRELVRLKILTHRRSRHNGTGGTPHLSGAAYFDAHNSLKVARRVTPVRSIAESTLKPPTPHKEHTGAKMRSTPARLTVYADMIKVDFPTRAESRHEEYRGGGKRGTVTGFSRASRKRMLELMARVRLRGSMFFVTMTYDDESLSREDFDLKAEFEAFRRRFERTFPTWGAIWRMELVTRKSGIFQGLNVPHYHLIIFTEEKYEHEYEKTVAESIQSWGAVAWQEITSSFSPYHLVYGFKVETVRSRRHAYHYISKYVGKEAIDDYEVGRRWGRIGKIDTTASEEISLSTDELVELRRLIRKWLKSRKSKYEKRFARQRGSKGFTVFGMGDNQQETQTKDICSGIGRLIWHAKVIAADKRGSDWYEIG